MIGFSAAILVTGLAIGASYGPNTVATKRNFEIVYPDLSHFQDKPCLAEDPLPCAFEAAALVNAIAHLEAAREVAEAAYQAWSDCIDANGGPSPEPNPNPPPRTVGLTSVLEATK